MSGEVPSQRTRMRVRRVSAALTVRQVVSLLCSSALGCDLAAPAMAVDSSSEARADADSTTATNEDDNALTEVVVTATRRKQSLQDIPYNISAVGGDALKQAGITTLNSLADVVPGLQNVDTGPNTRGGNSNFSMRGLRTDSPGTGVGAATYRSGDIASVSTYYGETPVFFPLAVKDIDRVEVLKGPQGTLYGSGAEGGTIRLIPKRPEFDSFSADVNVQGGMSQHSNKGNSAVDGVVNIPVAPNFAIRVAAGFERLGGFINAVDLAQRENNSYNLSPPISRVPGDPYSGYELAPVQRGTNNSEQDYARVALRWKVSSAVDAEFSYLHQKTRVDDTQVANPNYKGGTYSFNPADDPNSVNTYRPGGRYDSTFDSLSPSSNRLDLGNLTLTADVGFATFTSSSSYSRAVYDETSYYTSATQIFSPDGSTALNFVGVSYNGYPRAVFLNTTHSVEEDFTQEVRLVSNGEGPFSYVLGGYYQAQDYDYTLSQVIPGYSTYLKSIGVTQYNPQTGDVTYGYPWGNGFRFRDKALFGELSYKITPEWQVTGGVRVFWQDFDTLARAYAYSNGAPYSYNGMDPSGLSIDTDNTRKFANHIFKANTSYDISKDLKVYATFSEGFRRGGANALVTAGAVGSLPTYLSFEPDFAKNYEAGVKGALFNGQLRYTADVFLIDLKNFQFNGVNPGGFSAVFNGTSARSKGIEADADMRVTHDLTLRVSYSYTDAKVREGVTLYDYEPGTLLVSPADPTLVVSQNVQAGARLPGVPKSTVNVGADYIIRSTGNSFINLHGDAGYKSSEAGYIDPTSVYYWKIPSSTIANVRVTYDSGSSWSTDLFVNNVTDATAYNGGIGAQAVSTVFSGRYVARPRTFGLGLHYHF
jgi:iron complex outermembrane receptor protein